MWMLCSLSNSSPDPSEELCAEERILYKLISGLHSSISVHIASDYLLDETTQMVQVLIHHFLSDLYFTQKTDSFPDFWKISYCTHAPYILYPWILIRNINGKFLFMAPGNLSAIQNLNKSIMLTITAMISAMSFFK